MKHGVAAEAFKASGEQGSEAVGGWLVVGGRFDFDQLAHGFDHGLTAFFEVAQTSLQIWRSSHCRLCFQLPLIFLGFGTASLSGHEFSRTFSSQFAVRSSQLCCGLYFSTSSLSGHEFSRTFSSEFAVRSSQLCCSLYFSTSSLSGHEFSQTFSSQFAVRGYGWQLRLRCGSTV